MRFFEWRRVETWDCFYHAARLRSHKTVRICNAKCSAFSGLVWEALIVHKLKMQSVCTVTQTCNYMHKNASLFDAITIRNIILHCFTGDW